jgi:hypothetical protein
MKPSDPYQDKAWPDDHFTMTDCCRGCRDLWEARDTYRDCLKARNLWDRQECGGWPHKTVDRKEMEGWITQLLEAIREAILTEDDPEVELELFQTFVGLI